MRPGYKTMREIGDFSVNDIADLDEDTPAVPEATPRNASLNYVPLDTFREAEREKKWRQRHMSQYYQIKNMDTDQPEIYIDGPIQMDKSILAVLFGLPEQTAVGIRSDIKRMGRERHHGVD